jgi:hypothetical protein
MRVVITRALEESCLWEVPRRALVNTVTLESNKGEKFLAYVNGYTFLNTKSVLWSYSVWQNDSERWKCRCVEVNIRSIFGNDTSEDDYVMPVSCRHQELDTLGIPLFAMLPEKMMWSSAIKQTKQATSIFLIHAPILVLTRYWHIERSTKLLLRKYYTYETVESTWSGK